MAVEWEPNEVWREVVANYPPICEARWVYGRHHRAEDRIDEYWLRLDVHGRLSVWLEDVGSGADLDLVVYQIDGGSAVVQGASRRRGSQNEEVVISGVGGQTYVVLVERIAGSHEQPYRLYWTLDRNWPLTDRLPWRLIPDVARRALDALDPGRRP